MSDQFTKLITMLLIFSIIVLVVLVVALIMVVMKKKKEEELAKENFDRDNLSKDTIKTSTASISATKTFSLRDVRTFLDFEEIKDNMIIQNKGRKIIMVVKCQGVNYDLMSSIEKTSIEQGYVQFLNALTRPIQLYIQSRKIDLEENINNYKKRLRDIESRYNKIKFQYEYALKNEESMPKQNLNNIKLEYVRAKNIYDYTRDIIENTEKISQNKKILTKNYYLIISYVPETDEIYEKEEIIDRAFNELYTNAQSLLRVLSVCGVTGKILDSEELADLLYVAYNRDSSEVLGIDKMIKAGFDSLYVTAPDVIEKKMKELDKKIENDAIDLANATIENVKLKSKARKELEEKENNVKEIVKSMARMMIEENIDYLGEELAQESIEEIANMDDKPKKKAKKGA